MNLPAPIVTHCSMAFVPATAQVTSNSLQWSFLDLSFELLYLEIWLLHLSVAIDHLPGLRPSLLTTQLASLAAAYCWLFVSFSVKVSCFLSESLCSDPLASVYAWPYSQEIWIGWVPVCGSSSSFLWDVSSGSHAVFPPTCDWEFWMVLPTLCAYKFKI